MMALLARKHTVLPGFELTLGVTLFTLSVVALVPLAALVLRSATFGWTGFWDIVTAPRVVAACRLSIGSALIAAFVDTLCGTVVAWALVRYRFPGQRILDALIDLPFALPTAVSGIALTTIYAPTGWLGGLLAHVGIRAAFSPLGVVIALAFVGLPFVVRTLQPAVADLDPEMEEAAASLGARRRQTLRYVVLPGLAPAVLTGFGLALARALGEYGSVVFISGNLPMRTEIAPLLIVTKLEQYDEAGATAIAVALLAVSFGLLLTINLLQRWARRGRV